MMDQAKQHDSTMVMLAEQEAAFNRVRKAAETAIIRTKEFAQIMNELMKNEDNVAKWRHQGNRWGVGASPDGEQIRILGLRAGNFGELSYLEHRSQHLSLSREHALELAAWIVAVATPREGEFERILAYVRGS